MNTCLVLYLASCCLGQSAAGESMNVITWNIRYDNPADGANRWANRKDWVAEIVNEHQPDLAGFQEVLAGQFEDLKTRLPDFEGYGVGRDDGQNAGEFAPIFHRRDRFDALDKSTFWLSATPDVPGSKGWDAALPRIATWIKLKDRRTNAVFYAVNTHFDHRGEQARAESAALLVKCLGEKFSGCTVVLTGDFNVTPDSRPYQTLIGEFEAGRQAFFDTYARSMQKPVGPNSTWNGFKAIVPGQRIDFVFTTKSITAQKVQILDSQRDGKFPSDHLPVIARLVLTAE